MASGLLNVTLRILRKLKKQKGKIVGRLYVSYLKKASNLTIGSGSTFKGRPRIIVNGLGSLQIGSGFKLNSGPDFNPIGRNQQSLFYVSDKAILKIGDNVGMSSVAIYCQTQITIGDNVRFGGNTVVYDTDFHSLYAEERTNVPENRANVRSKPVVIGNNVFVGAHSLILKGVEIGEGSIVGGGSVVTTSIPANEIWGGNPARFIRKAQ
jgi:acetyltransferase-like isoleucine patch superfamily enzyme